MLEALLGRIDPTMGVLIAGGAAAITWLARLVIQQMKEAREDRAEFVAALKATTETMAAMRAEIAQVTHSMEQLAQMVAHNWRKAREREGG